MNEELMRLFQALVENDASLKIGGTFGPSYLPSERDLDLIRENLRAIREEEERVKQYLREEAYRSGVDVPPDASMQRLREEAYRIPSPPRVEMFDPAVGSSVATTRDDPMSLLLSLLR